MLEKENLREKSSKIRKKIFEEEDGIAARKVASQIIMLPELDTVKVVSGYYPIRSEMDILVTLKALHAARFPIALPKIVKPEHPLEFKSWDMQTPLIDGPFGTKEPTENIVNPEVILLPMLAFDDRGARLGYGGGYYDRTLEALRRQNPELIAIGVAYEDQKLDAIPVNAYDQPLDMVITEKTTYRFS